MALFSKILIFMWLVWTYPLSLSGLSHMRKHIFVYLVHSPVGITSPMSLPVALLFLSFRSCSWVDPLVIVKRSVSPQNWICGTTNEAVAWLLRSLKWNLFLWAHRREENNVANSMTVCKQHNHSVDTNTQTSGWRQTIFQRSHVIFVIEHGFVVTCSFSVNLFPGNVQPDLLRRLIR